VTITAERKLPGDWYDGIVPANVVLDPAAHLETTYSFNLYRSRADVGLRMAAGAAAYNGTMFDVGPRGRVTVGGCTMINVARIVCDERVEIGNHVLVSWNAVIMDTYRASTDPAVRRRQLERFFHDRSESPDERLKPRPVRIGDAAWLGFDSVVLPGVTIGEGSVVACRSVVVTDVPPFTVVAGNPAQVIRDIAPGERAEGNRHA